MFSLSGQQGALLSLAPTVLRNGRARRYHGDDLAISLEAFVESDRERLHLLYAFLQKLFIALQEVGPARELAFQTLLANDEIDTLAEQIRQLGPASYAANPTPLLAKTIHDVRGGGLTPLLGQIQFHRMGIDEPHAHDAIYFLTRDHLKIMRNALLGLDDAKRNEDLEIKVHGTDFIVEKWHGTRLQSGNREIYLQVECPQSVAISECCVEFGALDRILYNLLNNACRHTADENLQLVLFPIPDERGENLRFILLNAVTDADAEHLRGTDLETLFSAGVSTTGSGYGLNVAAEFVANAFGLATPEEAVAGRYLGAHLFDDTFAVFFHWPIVADV